MDYQSQSPHKADSPLSYDVEEGELSAGSGRSSLGTIREKACDCSTQTEDHFDQPQDKVTTMRVEVENTTSEQHTQTALNQRTPQEIARIFSEQIVRPKQSDARRNLESFRNRTNNNINEQGTSTNTHTYQINRPHNNNPNKTSSDTFTSPPLPIYPPPVRPPPPDDYTTDNNRMQHSVQQRWFNRNSHHI